MIFARIIYGTGAADYHDITSIWDYDGDGKAVSGVEFWSLEGRITSFECAMNDTIRWIMNRERTEPGAYKLHYGIRKAKVQVYDTGRTTGGTLISEGYLTDDSFKTGDWGTDVNGDPVELVRIKYTDLFGCLVKILQGKTIHLTASNQMTMIYDLINTIIWQFANTYDDDNNYPNIWLQWIALQNQWQAMPDYGYEYNRFRIKSLAEITDGAVSNGVSGPVVLHKDYMTIQAGTSSPLLTIVRYDKVNMGLGIYTYCIHILKYNIIGATAALVSDIINRTYPYPSPNDVNYLLTLYGQPGIDDTSSINGLHLLTTDFGTFEIINNELLFTGHAYIDRVQIAVTGDYAVADVLAVCLNILYGWLDVEGHTFILKNKLPWDWEQTAIEILDSGKIEAETVMREMQYNPDCDWLAHQEEIIRIINDYHTQAVAGLLMDISFTTCQDVTVGQYIKNRGYVGYITKVQPMNILTPEKQINAIGYYMTGGTRDFYMTAPTPLMAYNNGLFDITWDQVPGATGYKIYFSEDDVAVFPDNWTLLSDQEGTAVVLNPGADNLFVRVMAYNDEVDSEPSYSLGYYKRVVADASSDNISLPFESTGNLNVIDGNFAQDDIIQDMGSGNVATYYEGYGWYGPLTETGLISGHAYEVFRITGNGSLTMFVYGKVSPIYVVIEIAANETTMFSLPGGLPVDINSLDIDPLPGDVIQDQYSGNIAEYVDGYGWYSIELNALLPGHVYQYQRGNAALTLIFTSA